MNVAKVYIIGRKKVEWVDSIIEQFASTPTYDWSEVYDQNIVLVMEDRTKITIPVEELVNQYTDEKSD